MAGIHYIFSRFDNHHEEVHLYTRQELESIYSQRDLEELTAGRAVYCGRGRMDVDMLSVARAAVADGSLICS